MNLHSRKRCAEENYLDVKISLGRDDEEVEVVVEMLYTNLALSLTVVRVLPWIPILADCFESGGMVLRRSFVHIHGNLGDDIHGRESMR